MSQSAEITGISTTRADRYFFVHGEGWYQEWGQPARKLHPGDVVYIAPEIKHWHGATKDEWFTHVALEIPAEGASNEWCEPVSDEQYNAL